MSKIEKAAIDLDGVLVLSGEKEIVENGELLPVLEALFHLGIKLIIYTNAPPTRVADFFNNAGELSQFFNSKEVEYGVLDDPKDPTLFDATLLLDDQTANLRNQDRFHVIEIPSFRLEYGGNIKQRDPKWVAKILGEIQKIS